MADFPIDAAIIADSAYTADAVAAYVVDAEIVADSSVGASATAAYVADSSIIANSSVTSGLRAHYAASAGIVANSSQGATAKAHYAVSAGFIGVGIVTSAVLEHDGLMASIVAGSSFVGVLSVVRHVPPPGPPPKKVPQVRMVPQPPPVSHAVIRTNTQVGAGGLGPSNAVSVKK